MDDARTETQLVQAVRGGDQQAFGALFERYADRCFDVARRIVADDARAADVTQEVFTVAWQQIDTLRDPSAFGGWVLRSARNRALNKLRDEKWASATDDAAPVFATLASGGPSVEAEAQSLEHRELVWAAATALGDRDASILDLHLRHDLSVPEIAEELGVTANNAHQLLYRMKQKLAAGIRAYVLVRGGDTRCPALRVTLADAGITRFGPDAVTVINQHVKTCDDCDGRQAALVAPEAMFAAVPIVGLGVVLKAEVAHGLTESGVPVGPGSTSNQNEGPTMNDEHIDPAEPEPVRLRPRSPRRNGLLIGGAVAAAIALILVAVLLLGGGDDGSDDAASSASPTTEVDDGGSGGGGEDQSPDTSTSTTTTTAPAGDELVGAWTADASEILGANTANVGGPGGLTCSGPITMTFSDDGTFSRNGAVECTVAGTSRSGAVSNAGTYSVSGDQLVIGGSASTGDIPDAFGDGTATYAVAGDTLTITFTIDPVGTVIQTYQRG